MVRKIRGGGNYASKYGNSLTQSSRLDFVLIFYKTRIFGNRLCFLLQGNKAPILVNASDCEKRRLCQPPYNFVSALES